MAMTSLSTPYEEWKRAPSNRLRPLHHLLLLAVLAVLVVALLWAHWAVLDEVTRGEGRVIPSSQVQVVQNLEGGIVEEILVREGSMVKQGDLLVRLSGTQFVADAKQNRLEVLHLQAKIARLEAEVEGRAYRPPQRVVEERPDFAQNEAQAWRVRKDEFEGELSVLRAQMEQRKQELAEMQVNVEKYAESLKLAKREMEIAEKVRAAEVMPEIEMVRLKRDLKNLQSQHDAARIAIPRLEAAIREIQHRLDGERRTLVAKASGDLNEARARLSQLQEQQYTLNDRRDRTGIRSPVEGVVKRIHVTTRGGVIQPGMEIMEIVPLKDQLLIEARIRPADIGFLRPNQPAMVKFTAYDATIYGGLSATLEHISADTILDEKGERYYRVRLRTEKSALGTEQKPLPIVTGMTATVELLTGQKTVLDYLLKPILKAQQNALRER